MDQSVIDVLNKVADDAHREIWCRFMSPDSLIYDYAGLNGEVSLPTPEECRDCKPNAMGWWSPIEDCAFFTGDYLTGQCRWHRMKRSESRVTEIRKMVKGLFKTQDVCCAEGMIARGIGSDGKCHPRASSNDQVIPWLLALREYLRTDIPSEAEREECRGRMLRLLKGLRTENWSIPGEGEGFHRGSFLHIDGLEGRLSSVHLAFALKLLAELGEPEGEKRYKEVMFEPLANGKTRLQIIAEGDLEFAQGHAWFTAHTHYAVRELLLAEREPSLKKAYSRWLKATGALAVKDIEAFKAWAADERAGFNYEWRGMLKEWKPQSCCADAERVAWPEAKLWHEISPAIHRDKTTALWSLPAAWMTLLSEDRELIERATPAIMTALTHFDYSKLHYAAFFCVEAIVAELLTEA